MSGSSNGQVRVDTEKLQEAARKLEQLTTHMQSVAENFREDCDAYGDVIGDDKNGKKFKSQYEGPHKDAVTAGYTAGKLLDRTTGEINQLVRALENVEQQSAETGRRLHPEINGG
ncbi:hypothetical protein [Streptomyces sp. NPDC054765]